MSTTPSASCTRSSNTDASPLKPAEHPVCADGHDRNASRSTNMSFESSASPVTTSSCDPLSKYVTAHKGLEIAHRQGEDDVRACAADHEQLKMSVEPKT